MNVIAAQEIKRRGIGAVDEALENGPVHIIKNNRPQYVVLTEELYNELIEVQEEAALSRIKAALEDARAGRVTRHQSVAELMRHVDGSPDK